MDEFDWKMFKKPRQGVEIAIVNLVDVIFILLIFFIMTTTFSKDTGIDVSKPQAATASEITKENIMIGVTRDGLIHLQESQVSVTQIEGILKRLVSDNPDRQVLIIADRDASVSTVVDIMDECNKARVRKVSLSAVRE